MSRKSSKKKVRKPVSPGDIQEAMARLQRAVAKTVAPSISKGGLPRPVQSRTHSPSDDVQSYRAALVLDAGLSGDVTEQAWARSIASTEAATLKKGAGFTQSRDFVLGDPSDPADRERIYRLANGWQS